MKAHFNYPNYLSQDPIATTMRALVLDSPALCRRCLASYLETRHIDVVGQASRLTEATDLVRRQSVDIVLLNVSLMAGNEFQLVKEIQACEPLSSILELSMAANDEHIHQAQQLGAHGYLIKDIGPEELLIAMRRVRQGGHVYPSWAASESASLTITPDINRNNGRTPSKLLTDREIQVLQRLMTGLTDRAIAEQLTVSEHTIKNRMKNIRQKLWCVQSCTNIGPGAGTWSGNTVTARRSRNSVRLVHRFFRVLRAAALNY